jgi:hypothetical protein
VTAVYAETVLFLARGMRIGCSDEAIASVAETRIWRGIVRDRGMRRSSIAATETAASNQEASG